MPVADSGSTVPPSYGDDRHAAYDPTTNTFYVVPSMTAGQIWVLNDASGINSAGQEVTPQWRRIPAMGPFPTVDGRVFHSPTGRLMALVSDYDSSMGHWVVTNVTNPPAQWTLVNPTPAPGVAPSGRLPSASGVDYDAQRNQLIFFGGTSRSPNYHTETFVRTNADGGGTPGWLQLAPTNPPNGRAYPAAVFDSTRDRLIVYGGSSSTQVGGCCENDIWVLDDANSPALAAWTRVGTGPNTGGRVHVALGFDRGAARLLGFGGQIGGGATSSNEVWSFGLTTGMTTVLMPAGTPPSPRFQAAPGYDVRSNRLVILGGSVSELWVLHSASLP